MTRNPSPESPVSFLDGRRSAKADDDAASRLFESQRPDLLRFAYWLARDRSVAEDVVQDALLRAWRSRNELNDPAATRPWLLTIVRREHARLYERKRLELTSLHDAIECEDGNRAAEGDGEIVGLRLAIMNLPDAYREPLVMQVLGGFTTEEIGRELKRIDVSPEHLEQFPVADPRGIVADLHRLGVAGDASRNLLVSGVDCLAAGVTRSLK